MSFGLNFRAISFLRWISLTLLVIISGSAAAAQCTKKPPSFPPRVSKTTINPHFDSTIDKTKFGGVRSLFLLDLLAAAHVAVIGYDEEYKAKNVDEFVKLISQSLQLPPAGWSSWRSRGQQMRCSDFQLIVQMVAGGPSLRVLDAAAEETVAQRRQAKEEQDAMAETAAFAEYLHLRG